MHRLPRARRLRPRTPMPPLWWHRPDRPQPSRRAAAQPPVRKAFMTRRERRLLAELGQGLQPVARPNIFVLLWRWRYELAVLAGLPATIIALAAYLGYLWTLADLAAITATLTFWPQARG